MRLPRLASWAAGIALLAQLTSGAVPPSMPSTPKIETLSESSVRVTWDPIPGVDNAIYNVLMNNVSVYSGTDTVYQQQGLTPETCYTFRVAGFANGRWTMFSKATKLTSSGDSPVDVAAVISKMEAVREKLEKDALGPPATSLCAAAGFQAMHYAHGDANSLEFVGSAPPASSFGFEAAGRNCELAKCSRGSMATRPLVKTKSGHLFLRLDNGKWKKVFVTIPAEQHVFEHSDPVHSSLTRVVPLAGCRANPLSDYAGREIGKIGAAGLRCLEVNCTAAFKPYYMCQAGAGPDESGEAWRHALNRASHHSHTLLRYESALKASPVPVIDGAPDKGLTKTMYEHGPYRESWVLTYLGELVETDAVPHYPLLYATFRCTDIPAEYKRPPGENPPGIVPAMARGAPTVATTEVAKADGGVYNTLWHFQVVETYHTDLGSELDRIKDMGLSEDFARGVAFMALWAVGVGRVAHGLFHNDLLSLSNLRFLQFPVEAKATPEFWCYSLNGNALGEGTTAPEEGEAPAEHFDGGGAATDEDVCAAMDASASAGQLDAAAAELAGADDGEAFPGETAGEAAAKRQDWCLPVESVDGLMLKLHNYQYASLKDRAFEWWRRGYTLQNTPWSDDVAAIGTILCQLMGSRITDPDEQRLDFCARAAKGEYYHNPLHALTHPYFAALPSKASVPPAKRKVFKYVATQAFPSGPPPILEAMQRAEGSPPPPGAPPAVGDGAAELAHGLNGLRGQGEGKGKARRKAAQDGSANGGTGENGASGSGTAQANSGGGSDGGSNGSGNGNGNGSGSKGGMDGSIMPPDEPEVPRMPTPWIVRKGPDSLLLEYYAPKGITPSLYMVLMNGVSVYSGVEKTYEQQGLDVGECYRFQASAFVKDKWLPVSRPVLVNDCNAFRDKFCRDHDCSHLSPIDL